MTPLVYDNTVLQVRSVSLSQLKSIPGRVDGSPLLSIPLEGSISKVIDG